MDVREKLVKLIRKGARGHTFMPTETIAKYLVENGVTVQEWISVKDRLPENEKPLEEYFVNVIRNHWPTSSYDFIDAPYDEEYTTTACFDGKQKIWYLSRSETSLNALIMPEDCPVNAECVTHWMTLPQPPKGE